MKSIALITYQASPELSDSDALLVAPLKRVGFEPHAVAWDASIDWKQFDSVIIRSCWDYHTRIDEFLGWLAVLEKNHIAVWNPLSVIRWNYCKTYLKDLEDKGIPIIPTIWLKTHTTITLPDILKENHWEKAVIKPTIGASANDVLLLTKENISSMQETVNTLLQKIDMLLQPFIKEVQTQGEFSVVFIGGKYSHTVLKKANPHEFRSNYEYRAVEQLVEPDKAMLEQATKIYQTVQAPLLYARVDGIVIDNTFTLMELELIEPYLFFDLFPKGAEQFAQAFKKLSR